MKFLVKNKVWLAVAVTVLIIVASTLMLARSDKYKMILFVDNKVDKIEKVGHPNRYYEDRHINMQAVEFTRDGEVIKSDKLDFSHLFDSYDIEDDSINRIKLRLNNLYYDKRKDSYFFSDYYWRAGPTAIWITLEIKKNIFSGKYAVVKEYQNTPPLWPVNNYPVGVSLDGKYLLHNLGFLCNVKIKEKESKDFWNQLNKKDRWIIGSAYDSDDFLFIDQFFLDTDSKGEVKKFKDKFELTLYNSGNQSLKTVNAVDKVNAIDVGYYSLPIVKSPHNNVFAFLFPYEDETVPKEDENTLPSFKFSLGFYYPDREKKIQIVKFDERFINIAGNSAMAWSNSSVVNKLAFSIFNFFNLAKANKLVIYDFKEKAVYDKITLPGYVKSLRWSPDDKKIGLLILEDKDKSKRRSYYDKTEGIIYIYDLKTKKLSKLMDCPDCFDFHFVE